MKSIVIPSIIARSQDELDTRLKNIKNLKPELIHLDVMDGTFVQHTSLEFDLKLPKRKYEAHLMLSNPEPWFIKNHKSLKGVIFHYESRAHLHALIESAKTARKTIGIAIKPRTPPEDIHQYISKIDKVLIMTVAPGKYGAKFLKETLAKITHFRKRYPKLDIQVDGGINPETIQACRKAGANQFVVGSFLQKSTNRKKSWNILKNNIKN